jgi:CrcB protein
LAAIIDIPRIPPQTTLMSQTLPLIALGGAIGSVLRYLMVAAIGAPWGTAAVNVLGSFAIGVLFVLLDARTGWQLFVMTGLLGGFTTFSAFSLDTLKLFEAGQPLQAALYVLGSVALSLIAVALGVALARGLA